MPGSHLSQKKKQGQDGSSSRKGDQQLTRKQHESQFLHATRVPCSSYINLSPVIQQMVTVKAEF